MGIFNKSFCQENTLVFARRCPRTFERGLASHPKTKGGRVTNNKLKHGNALSAQIMFFSIVFEIIQ